MKTKDAQAYKVRPNALVGTDDATMYADFIASTPTVDREDEIIYPEDFNTAEWKANPVWLWAHDKSNPPIGAGYRGDGSPAIDQSRERLILGCKFSQANPQGALTYALYKEGTLKMVSVGFITNTPGRKMAGKEFGLDRPVTRVMNPELVECSCVPIGMNRSAMLLSIKGKSWDGYVDRVGLASVLSKGHLHGEKVPDDMRRDLEPFATKGVFNLSHWSNKIPKFSSQLTLKGVALPTSSGVADVASIAKAPLKAGTIPVKTKAEDVAPSGMQDPEQTLSVGAQTFKAMMEAAVGLAKGGMEMVNQSDNPEIKKAVQKAASYFASGVKLMYTDSMKYFPDNKDIFAETATLAAQYEILAEEPDAAMANTEAEADMQDDIKADDAPPEKPTDDTDDAKPGNDKPDPDDDEDKAIGEVVTKGELADWAHKAFAEFTERIAALESLVAEQEKKLDLTSDLVLR